MKRILLVLLLSAVPCLAQNARYDNVALGPKGPIPRATIAVCTQPANTTTQPCTPLAALCSSTSDNTCTSPNPLTADSLGNYNFYAKPGSGPFTVQIYGPQVAAAVAIPDQSIINLSQGANNIATFKFNSVVWLDDVKYTTLASSLADVQCFGGGINTNCAQYINSNHNETFTTGLSLGNSGNSAFQHVHGMPGAHLNCNVTGGGNCFTMQGGAAISGEQTGEAGNTSGGFLITYPSTANIACVFCVPGQNGGQSYINLHDLFVAGNASATVPAVADLVSVNNQPVLSNLYFNNFPSVGMQVRTVSNAGAVAGPMLFLNDWMDGSANTNAQPWTFTSSGNTMLGLNLQGGVANHPGSSKSMMFFNGNKGVANSVMYGVNVTGMFFENLANGTSKAIQLKDTEGVTLHADVFSLRDTDTAVDISQTAASNACNAVITGLVSHSPTNGQVAINNHITGFQASGFINIPLYVFGGDGVSAECAGDLLPVTFDGLGLQILDHANHVLFNLPENNSATFRTFADASDIFTLDAGATASQQVSIAFNDRNTLQWQLGKSSNNTTFQIQDTLNSFKNHIQFTQTANTPEVAMWRWGGKLGTATTTGQCGTFTNFGTGASCSAVRGVDGNFQLTVASGTAPSTPATFIYTFKDGAWVNAPICVVGSGGGTIASWGVTSPTTTTITIQFNGTPAASTTYVVNGICAASPN